MKHHHTAFRFLHSQLFYNCLATIVFVFNFSFNWHIINVQAQEKTSLQQEYFNKTLVVLPEGVNKTAVEEYFAQYQYLFNTTTRTTRMAVKFENGKDLKTLVKYLESSNYSIVLYLLSQFGNFNNRQENNEKMDIGFCNSIASQYSLLYEKVVLFWPCHNMKKSQKYLPSYETISFAIKSVSKQFEWKEAVLFASESDWGLPLAIAANLHVPYRIKIGMDNFETLQIKDHDKKVLIVCAPLSSEDTSRIVERYKHLKFAKILLIDIIGSVFHTNLELYKKFTNHSEYHNILVLTILNEKLKTLLNITSPEFIHYFNKPESNNDNIMNNTNLTRDLTLNAKVAEITNQKNDNLCNLTTLFNKNPHTKEFFSQCEIQLKKYCGFALTNFTDDELKVTKMKQLCREYHLLMVEERNASNLLFPRNNNRILFSQYFNLFNYIFDIINGNSNGNNNNGVTQFDFVILDFKNIASQMSEMKIVWRPFLVLQQNQLNQNQFTMHTIIPEYFEEYGQKSSSQQGFWSCGIFCYSIIAVGIFLLLLIIIGSIFVGIAVRNYLLKKRLSKGPNKVVLSASDFVFPVDSRRVVREE